MSDLYTVPDLRELDLVGQQSRTSLLTSETALRKLTSLDEVLVTGDSQSGKTSLARRVFAKLRDQGFVPVLLTAPKRPLHGRELDKALGTAFSDQYSSPSSEAYNQLPRSRRAVIVDDIHLMAGKVTARREFRAELSRIAARVLYFAHDLVLSIEDLLGFEDAAVVKRYQIQPLGHARRAELIERWASLGRDEDDEQTLARSVRDTTRLVDAIIGKNFVPPYPPYVLALIQAQASTTVVDANAGTHGYFYELLIRCALARDSSADEYDITMSYLAHLAGVMLDEGQRFFSSERLREVHRAFEERIDVTLEFDRMVERLMRRNILGTGADGIGFRYPYLYYYFVASRLRDTIATHDTRARITEMAKTLHVAECANILLFLAHLSREPFIIDTLLSAARAVLPDATAAVLTAEEYTGADLATLKSGTETFLEADSEQARRQAFAEMDRDQLADEVAAERTAAAETAEIARVGRALASLQLLGQVVKNFPSLAGC